jgi:hypothetical protein
MWTEGQPGGLSPHSPLRPPALGSVMDFCLHRRPQIPTSRGESSPDIQPRPFRPIPGSDPCGISRLWCEKSSSPRSSGDPLQAFKERTGPAPGAARVQFRKPLPAQEGSVAPRGAGHFLPDGSICSVHHGGRAGRGGQERGLLGEGSDAGLATHQARCSAGSSGSQASAVEAASSREGGGERRGRRPGLTSVKRARSHSCGASSYQSRAGTQRPPLPPGSWTDWRGLPAHAVLHLSGAAFPAKASVCSVP